MSIAIANTWRNFGEKMGENIEDLAGLQMSRPECIDEARLGGRERAAKCQPRAIFSERIGFDKS